VIRTTIQGNFYREFFIPQHCVTSTFKATTSKLYFDI